MIKEVLAPEIHVARCLYPPLVDKQEWRGLARSIFWAIGRGHSPTVIWDKISEELTETLRKGSRKEKKEVRTLAPYITKLFDGVSTISTPKI
jgi:hypothetical protein